MGKHILVLWCACGHHAHVDHRHEWFALTRDQLLPRFRCSACGARPIDMRRVWHSELDRIAPTP